MTEERQRNYGQLIRHYTPKFQAVDESTVDLIEEISALMQNQGHPEPRRWIQKLDQRALDTTIELRVRRILINRFWRTELGMLEVDTTNERFALSDNGPVGNWLCSVAATVIPIAVQLNLPR